jgi:integrase/recombinase XerD
MALLSVSGKYIQSPNETIAMPPRKRPVQVAVDHAAPPADPSQHLTGFIHYLKAECGLSENTILAYRRDLTRFHAWYREHGPALLQLVDLGLLTRYLQDLHDHQFAATSMARHLVSLKMFFRYLVLESILPESVVELVNSPKLWQHLPKVLSPEKVDELIAAPSPHDRLPLRDRALMALMYATGCRASEVCGITLRDIQLEEGYCRCVGKGNKERIVSLNPVARAAVEAYLKAERPSLVLHEDATIPLLVSRTGKALSRITVWKLVKRYAARIGASREVSPHTLRHSFATHMLAGGAEIRALQELLGHASIRTTQIYTQVDHSRLKSIHEKCHPRG